MEKGSVRGEAGRKAASHRVRERAAAASLLSCSPEDLPTCRICPLARRPPSRALSRKRHRQQPRHGCSRPVGPSCRSEEHTSELQSLIRISYAVFCLKKKKLLLFLTTPSSASLLRCLTSYRT